MVANQNEVNPASRVTDRAGMISRMIVVTLSEVIGAITMPAKPASMEPATQAEVDTAFCE
jgi:hypothetical protein